MGNLKELIVGKLGEEVVMKKDDTVFRNGAVFDLTCRSGDARFLLGESDNSTKIECVYFIYVTSDVLERAIVESVALGINGSVDLIKLVDGKDIPLHLLSFSPRTQVTMSTGYMGNAMFETVGDVLQKSQEEIMSTQKQLGTTCLKELVEVLEALGYEVKK